MKKYKSVCHKIMASLCTICLLAVLIPTSHTFITEASANNETDIVDLVSNYMHARKSVLMNGTSDKLHCFAVEGIVSDEVNHKEVLDDEGILIFDSSFVITNVEEDGINTSVDLLEAISYSTHGNHANSEVAHSLRIMSDEKDNPIVVSDIYAEALSSFESCSYIAPDELTEASALALGGNSSSSCLEYMARTQIGYKEKASNSNLDSFTANAGSADYTKYGAWYGLNPAPWCAMFVSWCARQVNIPTSVIPQYSSCTAGMATFKDILILSRGKNGVLSHGRNAADLDGILGEGQVWLGECASVPHIDLIAGTAAGERHTAAVFLAADLHRIFREPLEHFCEGSGRVNESAVLLHGEWQHLYEGNLQIG